MAEMSVSELRQLPPKKLGETLGKLKRELAVSKFHVQTGQNQNTADLKKKRQTIARAQTVLAEQQNNVTSETK